MVINYNNLAELRSFYFHDSIFTGFSYDYSNCKVFLTCKNHLTQKKQEVVFHNTVFLISQNCAFWGGGNAILGISAVSHPAEFNNLMSMRENNSDLSDLSRLDVGGTFITLEIAINSGDVILITCQSVEIFEVPFYA